ncbi:MAG: SCO family protein [Chitinophagaceae bacterium]|nr:MAG: SCO family protein [Chitinophagaceae bacterium]
MGKKSILALCLAVLLPVTSYLLVRGFSSGAVEMPRRYYPDSVITRIVDGKQKDDTVWHKVQNVTLTNQLGKQVSLDDIQGKIIVADFFFTRCPSICPTLTKNMKRLQDGLRLRDIKTNNDTSFVQFLSFSVDPERDSVPVLKRYADRNGVNHDIWWMLTGPKKTIYDFAINEIKLAVQDGGTVDSNFIHTERFVLLDRNHVIRGYYNGLDSVAMAKLAEDMTLLMLEKDKTKKRKIF